jgi:hypothetical protein
VIKSVSFGPDAESMLMDVGVATMFCCTWLVIDNGILLIDCPSLDGSCGKVIVAGVSRYSF